MKRLTFLERAGQLLMLAFFALTIYVFIQWFVALIGTGV
jgi:hypothetical protein